jgi:hypothetical protein
MRQRQEDYEFKASLDYTAKPCLRNQNNKNFHMFKNTLLETI